MAILKDINTYLDSKEAVRAHLKGKVFASRAPSWVKPPYVVLQRIETVREYELANELGITSPTVQLDLYTTGPEQYLQSDEIFEEIRKVMSGLQGTFGDTRIYEVTIERDSESAERPVDASDDWTYRRSADFRITHDQTVPTH